MERTRPPCGPGAAGAWPVSPLELLVLGSGGPFAQAARASSSYVVLVGGRPRLLIDCGGGTSARLGQAGIDPAALEAVLLTHVMPELEDERDAAGQLVRASFTGPITWAHDLLRVPVPS